MRRMFQRGDMHGALVLLDVDDFKRINDNYGHDLGDAALQNLVAQIHECIRADDFFARFGGDEFVIWMDGIHLGDVEAIKAATEEAQKAFYAVSEKLYQQQGGPQGGAAGPNPGASDDGVVDADYEEVKD